MSRISLAALAATIACALIAAPAQATGSGSTCSEGRRDRHQGVHRDVHDRPVRLEGRQALLGREAHRQGQGRQEGHQAERPHARARSTSGTAQRDVSCPPIRGACQVLNLVLGPINLNLLGLSVRTNQINLRIDAVPGAGQPARQPAVRDHRHPRSETRWRTRRSASSRRSSTRCSRCRRVAIACFAPAASAQAGVVGHRVPPSVSPSGVCA